MRLPTPLSDLLRKVVPPPPPMATVSLTRKEFYDLAEECRTYARELARFDQTHVNLRHCHTFNVWLTKLKRYDLLAQPLATLLPARPIARWQIVALAALIGAILLLALPGRMGRSFVTPFLYGYWLSLFLVYFIPERLYGTTIELLEGKVLRVVDTLDGLLATRDLGFTEAAYFRIKQNLEAARRELREQIDIVHRRW